MSAAKECHPAIFKIDLERREKALQEQRAEALGRIGEAMKFVQRVEGALALCKEMREKIDERCEALVAQFHRDDGVVAAANGE
jgi:hypothetical protein